MLDQQVIANGVKRIFVPSRRIGLRQAFIQFEVENLKTQGLGGADFTGIPRQADGVLRRAADDPADGFTYLYLIHGVKLAKPCDIRMAGELLFPAGGKKFLDVFAKQVGFQVHGVAHLALAQSGDFKRVRDDPNAETFFTHGCDGQTHAIHRDRTLVNDVTQHLRRSGDFEDMIRTGFFPADDFAKPIHVAGHKMAAQLAVRPQRTLQVHQRTGPGELQVGQLPAFLQKIELEQPGFPARRNFHRRQAAAIDRDTVTDFDAAPANLRPNRQLDGPGRRPDFFNHPRFFNDACEHFLNLMAVPDFVEPRLINAGRQG
jgi:hypothetical protein